MKNAPKFETICGLFEPTLKWERLKPYIQASLVFAPGALIGGFGTFAETLVALDGGLTLAGVMDLLENTLFHTKNRKHPDFTSPYDLPRLANTMVIFAAWFDTIDEHSPDFWDKLELDEAGWNWLREEIQVEYQLVRELVGDDGRNILRHDKQAEKVLKQLYDILNEKTYTLSQGLVATESLRMRWNILPDHAVKKYFRYCEILERYDSYRNWVNKQFQGNILDRNPFPKSPLVPERLYLAPSTSLSKFRGRESELVQIRAVYERNRTVVLTGLGGMGKTELAIEFAKRQHAGVYFLTFSGSFRETIALGVISGMSEYSTQKLSPDVAFQIAWKRLNECSPEDLLILDNVDVSSDSLNEVLRELGKLSMRSLVTTRHKSVGAIPVGTLPVAELLEMFDDYDAPASMDDRLRLIRAVDCHTLTVNLIAQTLQYGMVSAQTILDALESQSFEDVLLPDVDAHFPGAQHQQKIYGHLRTVFRVSNMTVPAKQAMTCAVLLPQTGMDGNAFRDALNKESANALFTLVKNGWLDWQNGTIIIHTVIRLVCKNELNPNDENCREFLYNLSEGYDPNKYNRSKCLQLAEVFRTASDMLEDKHGNWANWAEFFQSTLSCDYDAIKHYAPGEFAARFADSMVGKLIPVEKDILPPQVVESFLDGKYETYITREPIVMYRVYGQYQKAGNNPVGANLRGRFVSTEFAESRIDIKQRQALNPLWKNTKMYEAKLIVPALTKITVGIAAPVKLFSGTILSGGAPVILLPENWPDEWILGYRHITGRQLQIEPTYWPDQPTAIAVGKESLYPEICPRCCYPKIRKLTPKEQFVITGTKGGRYTMRRTCLNPECGYYW